MLDGEFDNHSKIYPNETVLRAGEWLLVDARDNIVANAPSFKELMKISEQLRLDLTNLEIDRFPHKEENTLLSATEFQ